MSKFTHNHVVPAGYLRSWEVEGRLACHFAGEGRMLLLNANQACVRSGFYAAVGPDGGRTTDAEQAFHGIETACPPIFEEIESRWPLEGPDRHVVIEWLAVQALRSPASHDYARERVGAYLDEWEAADMGLSPEQIADVRTSLEDDLTRHDMMFGLIAKLGTLFGHAHWTLLGFSDPCLVTSDHPVVPVPLNLRRGPSAAPTWGWVESMEYRVSITPRHALLLSWRDVPDDQGVRRGRPAHAGAINASVIAQADRHWIAVPDTTPAVSSTPMRPLSSRLDATYTPQRAYDSDRRTTAKALVDTMIASGESVEKITSVTVARSSVA